MVRMAPTYARRDTHANTYEGNISHPLKGLSTLMPHCAS
jgi:hypothetical protein